MPAIPSIVYSQNEGSIPKVNHYACSIIESSLPNLTVRKSLISMSTSKFSELSKWVLSIIHADVWSKNCRQTASDAKQKANYSMFDQRIVVKPLLTAKQKASRLLSRARLQRQLMHALACLQYSQNQALRAETKLNLMRFRGSNRQFWPISALQNCQKRLTLNLARSG